MSTSLAPFYNNAETYPERLALSVEQREFTYRELAEAAERIASWVHSRPGREVKLVGIHEIREKMQRRVPKYMVPSEVRFLKLLPVSGRGKTDRKTLTVMLSEGAV